MILQLVFLNGALFFDRQGPAFKRRTVGFLLNDFACRCLQCLLHILFRAHSDHAHAGNTQSKFVDAGIFLHAFIDAVADGVEAELEDLGKRMADEIVPRELLRKLGDERGELGDRRFDVVTNACVNGEIDSIGEALGIVDAQVDDALDRDILKVVRTRVEQEGKLPIVDRYLDQAGTERLEPECESPPTRDRLAAAVANDVAARVGAQVIVVTKKSDVSHGVLLHFKRRRAGKIGRVRLVDDQPRLLAYPSLRARPLRACGGGTNLYSRDCREWFRALVGVVAA